MNLVAIFILIQYLSQHSLANPIEITSENSVTSSTSAVQPEDVKPEANANPKADLATATEKSDDDEELLETANFVFRPLFVYRQQQALRKRVYDNRNRNKPSRREDTNYYPYGYPSYGYPYYKPKKNKNKQKPCKKELEFPSLF